MARNTEVSEGKVNGLIDKGCSMEGRLAFDGTVQINGDFKGEIISDGTLVVGPEAKVSGKIQVSSIVIEGNVDGNLEAKARIDLRKGGKLLADIQTPSIAIEEGATFHGQCCMVRETAHNANVEQISYQQGTNPNEDAGDSLMM